MLSEVEYLPEAAVARDRVVPEAPSGTSLRRQTTSTPLHLRLPQI